VAHNHQSAQSPAPSTQNYSRPVFSQTHATPTNSQYQSKLAQQVASKAQNKPNSVFTAQVNIIEKHALINKSNVEIAQINKRMAYFNKVRLNPSESPERRQKANTLLAANNKKYQELKELQKSLTGESR
jgi:hypothetical protein